MKGKKTAFRPLERRPRPDQHQLPLLRMNKAAQLQNGRNAEKRERKRNRDR